MPHGRFVMTNTNPAPGNRCLFCDRLYGNRYKLGYAFQSGPRSPNGQDTVKAFAGYICPRCNSPQPPKDGEWVG